MNFIKNKLFKILFNRCQACSQNKNFTQTRPREVARTIFCLETEA